MTNPSLRSSVLLNPKVQLSQEVKDLNIQIAEAREKIEMMDNGAYPHYLVLGVSNTLDDLIARRDRLL